KNWVLLIAGSNGYGNYRHQADVCHAYQIAHANGIPDEQIVVMMYDDIANNEYNPVQGNIINRPGGPNVYPGVPKDYTGDDVNAETFLAVLQGNKEKVKSLLGREGKNSDSADLHNETLQTQFTIVRQETNKSHVMQYGDTSFTNLPVEDF
ncbi:hypothetical protein EGW08_003376, partial [Elysia chlorotica]